MRFVTFQDGGAEKIGVRQGDSIIDVSAAAAAFGGDMIGVIKGGDAAHEIMNDGTIRIFANFVTLHAVEQYHLIG